MVFVNASVLIPLAKTGKLWLLKKSFRQIKITSGVKEELTSFKKPGAHEIDIALKSWIQEEAKNNSSGAKSLARAENISEADAELIIIAKKQNEKILTNDYRLHSVAITKEVETEWLTFFIAKCAINKILSKQEAKETIFELVQAGMHLKPEVYAAIHQKLDELE